MSIEYCDNCENEVKVKRIVLNNERYIWKCTNCDKKHFIKS